MRGFRSLPLLSVCVALLPAAFPLAAQTGYQKPPQAIVNLLDAAPTPVVALSPDRKTLAIQQPASFPTITDLAQPELRLAGIRFSPATSGPSRGAYMVGLKVQALAANAAVAVTGLPAHPHINFVRWAPNGKRFSFVQMDGSGPTAGSSLWVAEVATHAAHRVGTVKVNGIFGDPCTWMSDSESLLCAIVPVGRGPDPKPNTVPSGPVISENLGKVTPGRTYEDLLQTPEDERIFEFYATEQLAVVKVSGIVRPFPVKGLLNNVEPSPDGHYALVEKIHRPFSFAFPAENFPTEVSVVDLRTGVAKVLVDKPLEDSTPIAFDAVPAGQRGHRWRSDAPATVVWAEAGDGGDPRKKVEIHDRVYSLSAPFTGPADLLVSLPMRYGGIEWGNAHVALVNERRRSDRKRVLLVLDPEAKTMKKLYEGSSEDRYHDPGMPVMQPNASGRPVLQFTADGKSVFFRSQGASPKGDQPFISEMPLDGGAAKKIWQSRDTFFEEPIAVLSESSILIAHESETVSPNYYLATPGTDALKQVTTFPNPYGTTPLPTKQVLHYKRNDGVDLTATLWVPAGYKATDGALPTLLEAYPAEFKTRAGAGQVAGSPYRFPRFGWGSPVFFATQGYAVLQNTAIPIIGEGDAEPNDTYTEQLVAGAKAGIDAGAATGAVDRKRVGVMGHSYGAFMTANLLAHSNLFRAGIARSGAYNRTLTPYGFQNETRTYWQDPKVYFDMSPFSFADKIKTPILLIHGMADDNQGTFPIQSDRFFVALKGQGATVRLVFLPLEAHHYDAHESVYHMLWEMERWLDTYVKPMQKPGTVAASAEE